MISDTLTVLRPVPAIPSITVGPVTEEREGVLLWVHTGTTTIETTDSEHRLEAGSALWMPPGVEHRTRAHEDSVVIPFRVPSVHAQGRAAALRETTVPSGWEDWLLYRWDNNSYVREPILSEDPLAQLVTSTPLDEGVRQGIAGALPLPRSREALDVARTLLRDPGSPQSLVSFAQREQVGAKTLQRQFVHETGIGFPAWRTRARIATAARLLSAGHRIGEVAQRVGYQTPTGFTKAFRLHTGLTPREFARQLAPVRKAGSEGSPVDVLERALSLGESPPDEPPTIPARTFWEKVNDHHELMWVYRGEATLRIGTRCWELHRGDALWVPAGMTHSVQFAAESLMMTVGIAHGRINAGVDDLTVMRFPPEWDTFLLHTMVGEFTRLRPATGHGDLVRELFRERFGAASRDVAVLAGVLGEIARALHRDPADPRSLEEWARLFGTTSRALGQEFLTQTGDTFPRWRARIRMDIAREMLRFGERPGQIFRRLGYATPSAFSRAFTAAYGISPLAYQRRENR